MNHTEAIKMMLENLDNWRHLPKYQLERRADVFFGLFIKQIIGASCYANISELSDPFPEFPFRYDKKNREKQTFHTVNFDYVFFRKKDDKYCLNPIVVELKTDLSSTGGKNNSYLSIVKDTDFSSLINDIIKVANKSKSKLKYKCLLEKLSAIGIIKKEAHTWVVNIALGKPQVIYLVPCNKSISSDINKVDILKKNGFKVICFDEIANLIDDNKEDSIDHIFAEYLNKWNNIKSGNICNE